MSLSAPEWISVGALAGAFAPDSHALPVSSGLSGRRFQLHLENGWILEYAFVSATEVDRTVLDSAGRAPPETGRARCSATTIRAELYFVSIEEPRSSARATVLLLDLYSGICTLIRGSLPTSQEAGRTCLERAMAGEDLTGVTAEFIHGAIDTPMVETTARHSATKDLIGRRIEYTYSATERYEHIYLNERLYTWHCLDGSERGLADTDRCHHLKLASDLYLFVWREKVVPTLGVVVIDLRQMKTTGRIVGYEGMGVGAVTSFPVGAHVRLIGPGGA